MNELVDAILVALLSVSVVGCIRFILRYAPNKYITGEIRGFLAHGGPQEPAPPARELEMCLWSAPGNKLNSSAQHGALRAT